MLLGCLESRGVVVDLGVAEGVVEGVAAGGAGPARVCVEEEAAKLACDSKSICVEDQAAKLFCNSIGSSSCVSCQLAWSALP